MTRKRLATLTFSLLCAAALDARAAVVELTLYDGTDPGGALFGQPGQTVGWGFRLVNNSALYWLLVNSTDYARAAGASNIGSYTDIYAANAVAGIAPNGGSFLSYYSPTPGTAGLGSYRIGDLIPVGSTTWGTIELTYDLWDGDPYGVGDPTVVDSSTVTADTGSVRKKSVRNAKERRNGGRREVGGGWVANRVLVWPTPGRGQSGASRRRTTDERGMRVGEQRWPLRLLRSASRSPRLIIS